MDRTSPLTTPTKERESLDAWLDFPIWVADDVPKKVRPTSLRWVYQHMIEEYARHNGHADLIRERIDGEVGD